MLISNGSFATPFVGGLFSVQSSDGVSPCADELEVSQDGKTAYLTENMIHPDFKVFCAGGNAQSVFVQDQINPSVYRLAKSYSNTYLILASGGNAALFKQNYGDNYDPMNGRVLATLIYAGPSKVVIPTHFESQFESTNPRHLAKTNCAEARTAAVNEAIENCRGFHSVNQCKTALTVLEQPGEGDDTSCTVTAEISMN
jgi:hypothetical protein